VAGNAVLWMQVCVQLCEAYKQQYMAERDAVRAKNPEKVRYWTQAQHMSCKHNHDPMLPAALYVLWPLAFSLV
jgi:hypothetical protein